MFMKSQLLVVGAVPHEDNPKSFGGVTILNARFNEFLNEADIDYSFIPLNKVQCKLASLINTIYFFSLYLVKVLRCKQVLFNATYKGIYYISPIAYIIARVFRKRFSIRIFAGNLDASYERAGRLKRFVLKKTILRSDFIFLESKYLQKYLLMIPIG